MSDIREMALKEDMRANRARRANYLIELLNDRQKQVEVLERIDLMIEDIENGNHVSRHDKFETIPSFEEVEAKYKEQK